MPDFTEQRKKRTEIRDLEINRVSLVKRPANGRRFLLLKQEEDTSMDTQGTAFEQEVQKRAETRISKGDLKYFSKERILAEAVIDLAAERPDLYEIHRQQIGGR